MFRILNRNRRGVGSIIGAVFLLLILLTGYVYYALQVNVTYDFNETLLEMQELSQKRSKENIEILTVTFDAGKLNMTVKNTGPYLAHLIWLGIFDEANNTQKYYKINFNVDPSETVTNVGNNSIPSFEDEERTIQIVTELGNTFSCSYPLSETVKTESEYDYVDSIGGPPTIGTHSFFSAMQSGPDGIMDKLTEVPFSAIWCYYPSGYNLVGGTTYESGSLSDLISDNSVYMAFKSYVSATSATTLYAHQDTISIGGTAYYKLLPSSADASGLTLSASMGSSRILFQNGKFVYSLQGVSSIPASTWTMYYRAWKDVSAIAFDNVGSGDTGNSTSTAFSWSHTTGSGLNRIMIVGVSIRSSSVTVSSISYGSQSLTYIRRDTNYYNSVRSELWYLIAPNSGINIVTVTLSSGARATGGSCTYTGVDQTSPIDGNNGVSGTTWGYPPYSVSQSVIVDTANSFLLGHIAIRGSDYPPYSVASVSSEGNGQTQRWDEVTSSFSGNVRGHGSDKGPVGAGSQSMSWTLSWSADWAVSVVAFRPASNQATGHASVDILIRKSDGSVRAIIATDVAASADLSSTQTTLSGTYSWTTYNVVDQTDYLEIDYYVDVTTTGPSNAYLRIDDNSLPTSDQTRATNVLLPSEYTVEVEFTGSSDTQSWNQIVWAVDSQFTTSSVTTTLQLWNYHTGSYPTSGDGYLSYTSSSSQGTDETKTQTITSNPTYFKDSSGNWKLKIKGVKTTTSQFSWKGDLIRFQRQPDYQLNLEVQWTNVEWTNETWLCICGGDMSPSENLSVYAWNGASWDPIIPILKEGWNNFNVTSYSFSSTFKIRFWTGTTDTGDTTQDNWQIDVVMLHVFYT